MKNLKIILYSISIVLFVGGICMFFTEGAKFMAKLSFFLAFVFVFLIAKVDNVILLKKIKEKDDEIKLLKTKNNE